METKMESIPAPEPAPVTEPAPAPAETAGSKKPWGFLKLLSVIFVIFWGVYFAYLLIDPKGLHPEYQLNIWSTLLLSFIQLIKWFIAVALLYVIIFTQVLKKRK